MVERRIYSEKQLELLRLWKTGGLRRINLLEGAVRSGKTWISLVLWAFWVAASPAGSAYLMAGRTLDCLRRNCLEPLAGLVGGGRFSYSLSAKQASLFGRRVWLEGAGDSRSGEKIRGLTLMGAYCDELTLCSREFFAMLLSRLSEPGAKLFATTNPDSPEHWLMREYISRAGELDLLDFRFRLEDNPFLEPAYLEGIRKEYTGVCYERFIRGEWVRAAGRVYPMFGEEQIVRDRPERGTFWISADYGTMNPFSAGLWCVAEGKAVRIAEFYHDGRRTGKLMTDEEYYEAVRRLAGGRRIQGMVADPSAASFIECVRRHGEFPVRKARNEVLDGIRVVASMLAEGRLLIHESCRDAIREFRSYGWDEKAVGDRPLKAEDHAMDDIRYFCATVLCRMG